jgi:hypothetical protein
MLIFVGSQMPVNKEKIHIKDSSDWTEVFNLSSTAGKHAKKEMGDFLKQMDKENQIVIERDENRLCCLFRFSLLFSASSRTTKGFIQSNNKGS